MFKSKNFCHIASNNRNQVKVGVFTYRTTDNLATVSASGYFNERIIDINLHDIIIHEEIDSTDNTKVKYNFLCVTERTLENVGTIVLRSDWQDDIEQAIEDLQTYVDTHFVKLDGSVPMLAPLRFRTQSPTFRGGIGAGMNGGVYFYDLDSSGNILPSFSSLTPAGLLPDPAGNMTLGSSTRKWKDAYIARVITSVINNGYDIAIPVTNSADTLALKSEVDLAANSGRMITDQGVWYAKMYAATVAPAAENGTNYADFSQTDGQGNPIIVIYERQNGAWVQDQTITPPAEYDGYVPITSKIWDITEQTGQQGGRILWNHQSKEFTPYPQIISFEDAALTGTSTAPTPTNSSPNDQIANKEYVDTQVPAFLATKADTDLSNVSAGIDFVVESQLPTSANNYTWYRKYKSGWVEQGGIVLDSEAGSYNVVLPVTMSDTNYTIMLSGKYDANGTDFNYANVSTTGFERVSSNRGGTIAGRETKWRVEGISA